MGTSCENENYEIPYDGSCIGVMFTNRIVEYRLDGDRVDLTTLRKLEYKDKVEDGFIRY